MSGFSQVEGGLGKTCFGLACGIITGVALASSLVLLQKQSSKQSTALHEEAHQLNRSRSQETIEAAVETTKCISKHSFAAKKVANRSKQTRTLPLKKLSRSTAFPSNGKQRIINQQSARRAVKHKRKQILHGNRMVRRKIHSMMVNTSTYVSNDRSNRHHVAPKKSMMRSNARLRGKGFPRGAAACSPIRGRRKLSSVEEENSEGEESDHADDDQTVNMNK